MSLNWTKVERTYRSDVASFEIRHDAKSKCFRLFRADAEVTEPVNGGDKRRNVKGSLGHCKTVAQAIFDEESKLIEDSPTEVIYDKMDPIEEQKQKEDAERDDETPPVEPMPTPEEPDPMPVPIKLLQTRVETREVSYSRSGHPLRGGLGDRFLRTNRPTFGF